MKFRYMILLSCFITLLNAGNKEEIPLLEKGEKRFNGSMAYRMEAFHFAWDIRYFEVLQYDAEYDKTKGSYLPDEKRKLEPVFQSAPRAFSSREREVRRWLAEAVVKRSYFWKQTLHPFPVERFRVLNFIDQSGRFKAIENRSELLQMLGEIDTEAELYLWLETTMSDFSHPYSYKRIGDLYRVRFQSFFSFSCDYQETFLYYDMQGSRLKEEVVKRRHDETCIPISL